MFALTSYYTFFCSRKQEPRVLMRLGGGHSFEPPKRNKRKGEQVKESTAKKARIRGRRLARLVYENLASFIQGDSIVPKAGR